MAATATDLTLAATVATELGVASSDALLPRYILVASDAIRVYLNRNPLHYSAAITELCSGYGRNRLVLQRLPVVSVTSITGEVEGLVSAADYELEDANAGLVYRRAAWPWSAMRRSGIVQDPMPGTECRPFTVVYAGGWVTPGQASLDVLLTRSLPYDIEEACVQTVVSMYRRRGQDSGVASETLGAASVSYRQLFGGLPDAARALLQPWRLVR